MSEELDKANLEKTIAETREAIANAAQKQAERDYYSALARKTDAEAEYERARADGAKMNLDRENEKRAKELAANEYHFVYHFTDAVSSSSSRACMAQLATWTRTHQNCEIEIMFSSPGGSVIDGMALFDYIQQIRAQGHKVTTSTIGFAASMAGILLQAGDHRVMGREAYILVHEVSFGASGSFGEIEDEVAFVKKMQSRILDIFAARTNLTKKQLQNRWQRRDWWLDSDEALKLGFVDEIR